MNYKCGDFGSYDLYWLLHPLDATLEMPRAAHTQHAEGIFQEFMGYVDQHALEHIDNNLRHAPLERLMEFKKTINDYKTEETQRFKNGIATTLQIMDLGFEQCRQLLPMEIFPPPGEWTCMMVG